MWNFLNKILRGDGFLFGAYMCCVMLGALTFVPFHTVGIIIISIGFLCLFIFMIFNFPK